MGAWGFGLGTLSFASDYVDGGAYNDGGLGMSLGLRLIPRFEIEGSYGHYTDSTLESSRNRLNRPVQLVGQVHPFPDSVVSPFVSGGYVWNNISIDDEYIADGENKERAQAGRLAYWTVPLVQELRSMCIRTLLWSWMVDCLTQ